MKCSFLHFIKQSTLTDVVAIAQLAPTVSGTFDSCYLLYIKLKSCPCIGLHFI